MARPLSASDLEKRKHLGLALILLLAVLGIAALLLAGPIPQDPGYHDFADSRVLFGIANFWNVMSNIPFLLVGALGSYWLGRPGKLTILDSHRLAYRGLFAGIMLLALGSGYYHFSPSNTTLVWDRLPITLVLMSLLAIVIGEFFSARLGRLLLLPLIVFGMLSVLYWYGTETLGRGDLRLYVLAQFFPMLVIPVLLACSRSPFTRAGAYWALLAAYLVAKLCEHFDAEIFMLLGGISGHTAKHLLAALGLYLLLQGYQRRQPRETAMSDW